MILLLSTCSQKMSESEFVAPIKRILDENNIESETRRCSDIFITSDYDGIIICGTALKDFEYMKCDLSWIREYDGKLLGICSGAQMIALSHDLSLEQKTMIGRDKVSIERKNSIAEGTFDSYFLISQKPVLGKEFLPLDKYGYTFKHSEKEVYGLLFHPEVLNKEIILKFIGAC